MARASFTRFRIKAMVEVAGKSRLEIAWAVGWVGDDSGCFHAIGIVNLNELCHEG